MDELTSRLFQAISTLDVVDAHEHLWPEWRQLAHPQDVLTLLQYSLIDLQLAGATPAEADLLTAFWAGPQAPLQERWQIFRKYLPAIRHTAPIRALFIALRDLYQCSRLDDDTYEHVSEQIAQARRPGIYRALLRERCGISAILNQNPDHRSADGFLFPVRHLQEFGAVNSAADIEAIGSRTGLSIRTPDDLLAALRHTFDGWAAAGTVAVKRAGTALGNPDRAAAATALAAVLNGPGPAAAPLPLQEWVENEFIAEAGAAAGRSAFTPGSGPGFGPTCAKPTPST